MGQVFPVATRGFSSITQQLTRYALVSNVMSWLTRLASSFVGDHVVRYLSIILFCLLVSASIIAPGVP